MDFGIMKQNRFSNCDEIGKGMQSTEESHQYANQIFKTLKPV